MKNLIKFLWIINIITLISGTFLITIADNNIIVYYISYYTGIISSIIGLVLLFNYSSTRKTTYWNFICIFLAILIIGVLMKILHLPFSNQIIFISLCCIGIIYVIKFLVIKNYSPLSFLKLLWIISTIVISNLIIFHFISDIRVVIFFLYNILIFEFCRIQYRKEIKL